MTSINSKRMALILVASSAACSAGEWKAFQSTEGAFAVVMPGEPLTTTQHSDSPAGKIALKTFTVKSAGGQVSYMVAYNDYPARMLRSVKPNDILTRVVRGALRDEDTVESQKSLTLKQHPGRDLRAKIKNGLLYDSRFFLVGSRLYQISIVSEPQAVRPEDRARFFNSFRLIDKQ